MNSLGRIIEIIMLVILIVITAYFYIKARKESFEAAKKADEEAKKLKEAKFVLTVKVDGMMCEKCASRVTQALSKLGEVSVNLSEKTVTITSDELTDAVEVESIITELGYKFEGIAE